MVEHNKERRLGSGLYLICGWLFSVQFDFRDGAEFCSEMLTTQPTHTRTGNSDK